MLLKSDISYFIVIFSRNNHKKCVKLGSEVSLFPLEQSTVVGFYAKSYGVCERTANPALMH